MAIAQFRHHGFECVQHVKVGTGIEIGGGQRRCGVQHQEMAYARGVAVLCKLLLNPIRDVEEPLVFFVNLQPAVAWTYDFHAEGMGCFASYAVISAAC